MSNTSNTYSFNPTIGTLGLSAFSRIQVRRTELTPQHLEDLREESNYQQAEWVNQGLELWLQDVQTFSMVSGQATYSIPPNTIMVLDLYITAEGENRWIAPISRTDYASLANPNEQGFPTSFFFLRTVAPTLTFWPIPDSNTTYTCSYWRYRQIQDASLTQGGNADIQYRFIDAYVAGLAHRLSRSYAPALETQRKADYTEAFDLAMKGDTENTPMYITPGLIGYFRS